MLFDWKEYDNSQASSVEAWLDAEAVKGTGLDNGFDDFFNYWKNEDGMDNFKAFVIFDRAEPIAVIAIDLYENFVKVMEIVVAPSKRSQGYGSKILNELTESAPNLFSDKISGYEAVIFPSNIASQRAFAKCGYHIEFKDPEGDLWKKICVKMTP
jgi:RimJ/RimL family protein N-acetyltransferase